MARKEKITRVIDGDSFETRSRKKPVRLANVDAPEKGQSGYQRAKQGLASLITGKTATIDTNEEKRILPRITEKHGEETSRRGALRGCSGRKGNHEREPPWIQSPRRRKKHLNSTVQTEEDAG